MTNKLDFSKPEELQTRDGRAVRIYATDHAGTYSVSGAVKNDKGWICASWNLSGAYGDDYLQRPIDLVRRPRRVTGWVNVHLQLSGLYAIGNVFESRIEARKASAPGCIGQIYVDAEIQK